MVPKNLPSFMAPAFPWTELEECPRYLTTLEKQYDLRVMKRRNTRDGWASAAITVFLGYTIVILVEQAGGKIPFLFILLMFLVLYIGTFGVITYIRNRRQ
jgi:hypothetical protein